MYRWIETDDVAKALSVGADPLDILESRIREQIIVTVNSVYLKEDKIDLTISSSVSGVAREIYLSKKPVKEILTKLRAKENVFEDLIFVKKVNPKPVHVKLDGAWLRNFIYVNTPFIDHIKDNNRELRWGPYVLYLPSPRYQDFIKEQRELYLTDYEDAFTYWRNKVGIKCRDRRYTQTTSTSHNGSTA